MSIEVIPVRRGAFSPLVMIALALVSVFAFAAFITLSAFEPELSSGRDGRAHALSRSAVGFAAAVDLARARGNEVHVGRGAFDPVRQSGLVVLTPERPLGEEEFYDVAGQSTLIVLPKWIVGPHPNRRGWVTRLQARPPVQTADVLSEVVPKLQVSQLEGASEPMLSSANFDGRRAGRVDSLQTISGDDLTPIFVDAAGRIILARYDAHDLGGVFVLSDPDFLNTQGLGDLDTARIAMAMLDTVRRADESIVFDVTLNGLGAARSALRLAFEPPFLGATLGLVLVAGLLGWRAALRSGPSAPRRRAIALGKAALADNSAALVRLTGREHKMGAGYARLVASGVIDALGAPRGGDDAETGAMLDRLAAAHGVKTTYTGLNAEAEAAKKPSQMLEAARKLHAWWEDMKRATR